MLRSLRQLYGKKLGASDGDIGHVKDFCFNDQQWATRYVVAHTASTVPFRAIRLTPSGLFAVARRDEWMSSSAGPMTGNGFRSAKLMREVD
jgi:hypothetical protein